ncbi:MAG TPA: MBL fold metallo-hydrolase [Patescibacteria group bacterium]|nr:MBL fold metallo-hydrolase [Patescibacteria group bacterium]
MGPISVQVTILGSGTIIPTRGRRATSLTMSCGNDRYLFDCGPGTPDALEESGLSFRDLKRVFITHYHPDHTLGIGHLLAALRIDDAAGGQGGLTLYGPTGIVDFIDRWHALYPATEPGTAHPTLVEVGGGCVYSAEGVDVRATGVDHDGRPALAYRLDAGGASIVYTGDTAYTESLVELARDVELLIAECSVPDDRPMAGHMTPSAVGTLAARSGAGRVVLVHLYPVFGRHDPAEAVRRDYPGSVVVAEDGMKIDV